MKIPSLPKSVIRRIREGNGEPFRTSSDVERDVHDQHDGYYGRSRREVRGYEPGEILPCHWPCDFTERTNDPNIRVAVCTTGCRWYYQVKPKTKPKAVAPKFTKESKTEKVLHKGGAITTKRTTEKKIVKNVSVNSPFAKP